jgi:hypothetical protein
MFMPTVATTKLQAIYHSINNLINLQSRNFTLLKVTGTRHSTVHGRTLCCLEFCAESARPIFMALKPELYRHF